METLVLGPRGQPISSVRPVVTSVTELEPFQRLGGILALSDRHGGPMRRLGQNDAQRLPRDFLGVRLVCWL